MAQEINIISSIDRLIGVLGILLLFIKRTNYIYNLSVYN